MLTIIVEKPGGTDAQLQFPGEDDADNIKAMFNPAKLTVSRSVNWPSQQAAKRDSPEMQFIGGEPATLTVDLLFDTYDTPSAQKESVRDRYTDKLLRLTTVEGHGSMHRPPVCRLSWGLQQVFFQGVLQQIETQFTMFLDSGMPVRATARCTFKQWISNSKDLQRQKLMSSDVAKVWIVRQGESLPMIASREYGDARQWRFIADSNGIDDPLALAPGLRLLLPARRTAWNPGSAS